MLKNSKLVTRQRALHQKHFVLKTIYTKYASILNNIIAKLLNKQKVLQAYNKHIITNKII